MSPALISSFRIVASHTCTFVILSWEALKTTGATIMTIKEEKLLQ